jgi:phosphoglycolate phosphatase
MGAIRLCQKGEVEAPLRQLHKDGYQLAILTNDSESSAKRNMQDIGVLDLFCTVVGADSGFGSKPGPHGFSALLPDCRCDTSGKHYGWGYDG